MYNAETPVHRAIYIQGFIFSCYIGSLFLAVTLEVYFCQLLRLSKIFFSAMAHIIPYHVTRGRFQPDGFLDFLPCFVSI